MKVFLLLLAVLVAVQAKPHRYHGRFMDLFKRSAECEDKYKKTVQLRNDGVEHTMCSYSRSPQYKSGKVADEDIQVIVDTHNEFRKNPQTSETAAAMCKMYWDPHIAKIAQHYAESCPDGHDKNNIVPGYGAKFGGQNLAYSSSRGDDDNEPDWEKAIQGWFDEVEYFAFGKGATQAGEQVGHYTQVVKDTACRVGCGYAFCPGKRLAKTYVCNYLTGQTSFSTPFETGKPCEKCRDKCVDSALCDTGGKICYHGTMDYETNTCKCNKPFTGDSCEILQCGGTDARMCRAGKEKCKQFSNWPSMCPVLCDLCTKDKTGGSSWIPAPAVKLKAGSSGDPGSFPAGRVKVISEEDGGAQDNSKTTVDCNNADNFQCSTPWFQLDWCSSGKDRRLTVAGVKYTPHSLCPHRCSHQTGCKNETPTCVDNDMCKNPMWFQKVFCKAMPNRKYARLNGQRYTPLELCPKSCGAC